MMVAAVIGGNPASAGNPYGPPDALFFASEDFVSPFTTVYFTDGSTGFPTSWDWKINGITFATTQNASYYFPTNGVYAITLIVTNAYGSDGYTIPIYVSDV
jgi:PKD repeat protein